MSTELIAPEIGDIETRQERALRRTQQLHHAFQSAFEVLAAIYRDEDWRYINDLTGRPYAGFTAFVQDQLGCAASNARRYQQGIVGLILPLQDMAAPGARIPVNSSDVARLGVTGARVVVEEAPAALEGVNDPTGQTEALRELIDSVAMRSTAPGFGPLRESSTPTESPLGALVPTTLPDSAEVFNAAWSDDPATSAASQAVPSDTTSEKPPSPAVTTTPDDPAQMFPRPTPAGGRTDHTTAELESAIAAVLAAGDPAVLAEKLSGGPGAALGPKCLASGQRLVR
jgi:hypothetical protein